MSAYSLKYSLSGAVCDAYLPSIGDTAESELQSIVSGFIKSGRKDTAKK